MSEPLVCSSKLTPCLTASQTTEYPEFPVERGASVAHSLRVLMQWSEESLKSLDLCQ